MQAKTQKPTTFKYYFHGHVSGPSEEGKTTKGDREHHYIRMEYDIPVGKDGRREHPDSKWQQDTLKKAIGDMKRKAVSWKTFYNKEGTEATVPVKGNIRLHGYSFSFHPDSPAIQASVEGGNSAEEAHPNKLRRERPKPKKKPGAKNESVAVGRYRNIEGLYTAIKSGDEIFGTVKDIALVNEDNALVKALNPESDDRKVILDENWFSRMFSSSKNKIKPEDYFKGAVYNQTTGEFGGHIYLPANYHRDEELSYPDNTGMGLHKMRIRGMVHHETAVEDKKGNVTWKYNKGGPHHNTLYHAIHRYATQWAVPYKGASQAEIEDNAHRLASDISRGIVQHQSIAHKEMSPEEVDKHIHHISSLEGMKAQAVQAHQRAMDHYNATVNSFVTNRNKGRGVGVNVPGNMFDPNNPKHMEAIHTIGDVKLAKLAVGAAKSKIERHQSEIDYHRDKLAHQRHFAGLFNTPTVDEGKMEDKDIDPKVAFYANMIKTSTVLRENLMAARPTNSSLQKKAVGSGDRQIASRSSSPVRTNMSATSGATTTTSRPIRPVRAGAVNNSTVKKPGNIAKPMKPGV